MAEIYEVKITRQAQEQMAEIVNYISNELFGPKAASNLLDKMENSIMSLAEFPERFQLVEEERKGPAEEILQKYAAYMKQLLDRAGYTK